MPWRQNQFREWLSYSQSQKGGKSPPTITESISIPISSHLNTAFLIVFLLATQVIFQCCFLFCNLSSWPIPVIPFNKAWLTLQGEIYFNYQRALFLLFSYNSWLLPLEMACYLEYFPVDDDWSLQCWWLCSEFYLDCFMLQFFAH